MNYDWLFEKAPDGYHAQLAWADANKIGLAWLPGNKWIGKQELQQRIARSHFRGATQLAFSRYTEPQQEQDCYICWLGIDCDEGPLDPEVFATCCGVFTGSLRSSCGGVGRHLLFRLAEPILVDYKSAGAIVKAMARPIADWLESHGQPVCKADKRVFYLEGGRNEWIMKTDGFHVSSVDTTVDACSEETVARLAAGGKGMWMNLEELGPGVRLWVRKWQEAGLLPNQLRRNMGVNISRFVGSLRDHGETVVTRSGLTTKTGVNGYVDLTEHSISLWSFADGHAIWRWVDL